MNRDEAKRYINEHPERYFSKAKHSGYICPICGSGSHKNGTGITEDPKSPKHFTCWGQCHTHGDTLEFIGRQYGLSNFNDRLRKGCEIYGIRYDDLTTENIPQAKRADDAPAQKKEPLKCEDIYKDDPDNKEQTGFYAECAKHIEETDYLLNRGISIETQKRFNIGYCKEWRSPKAPASAPATPRVIIPTSDKSYIARDTRTDAEIKALSETQRTSADQYKKMKHGNAHPFNLQALEQNAPCFITEGEIDALSIEELGFNAVGIGSVAYIRKFIDYIKAQEKTPRLILFLDEDEAGRKAQAELATALSELNKTYVIMPETGYKDANEYLRAFKDAMKTDLESAIKEFDREEEEARNEYKATATNFYIDEFLSHIKESVNNEAIATGFEELDNALDGGFYEGLYIIGAISSLGKTTFVMQTADQIAGTGKDVLILQLEMSKDELIAKSISRLTASIDFERNGNYRHAKTTRGILKGRAYAGYLQSEKDLINDALISYRKIAKNIFIKECNGATIEDIRNEIDKHYRATGTAPIVFIDYLQIITTADSRKSDKQAMDLNVSELKRISRDYKTPVVLISSFNRGNYSTPVDMESFKESGAIEYSSDVLIGLQLGDVFTGSNETDPEKNKGEIKKRVKEVKAKTPRPVELVILKNRNGAIPKEPIKYKFYPMFNLFKEDKATAQSDYYRAKNGY